MAIRIPQNQIQYRYTAGKEYMYKDTYREYQGHYYELNNQLFAGKEFNSNAPILVPIPIATGNNNLPGFNSLLTNAATYVYGKISDTNLSNQIPSSHIFKKEDPNERYVNRYFTQKVNQVPILIKEISEDSYQKTKTDPLYKSITIKWDTTFGNEFVIEEAEKQMPGIKEFLQDLNFNPDSDTDDYGRDYSPSFEDKTTKKDTSLNL
jgi:hypothetical protein